MRQKNREINIFNMSMLDVLTGALGAFVFLMLSFVPYYNIVQQNNLTPSEKDKANEQLKDDLEDLQEKKKELEEKVDQLVEQLKMVSKGDVTAEELAKLQEEIDKLRKEIDKLKARIVTLEAENDDLRDKITALKAEISELEDQITALRAEIQQLRDRIKELEKQLAERTDPEAAQMLKRAQAELFARDRSVFISGVVESEEKFSFLVRDPKGFWHDHGTVYEFGEKALRVETFSGYDAQERSERDERLRSNVMYLSMEGFLVPGEYLIGLRYAGEAASVSEFSGKNKPRPSLGQELLKEFGEPPPGFSSSPAPNPGPTSLLRRLPFSLAQDAVAQSTERPFGRGGSSPAQANFSGDGYPRSARRVFVRAMSQIKRRPMRTFVTEMPIQTLPVDSWVNILARVRTGENSLEFLWYDPLNEVGDIKDSIPGLAPGIERRELESKINAAPIEPIKPRPSCMSPEVCARVSDTRGDITTADLDPMFRDTIELPERIRAKERTEQLKGAGLPKNDDQKKTQDEKQGEPTPGSAAEKAKWEAARAAKGSGSSSK